MPFLVAITNHWKTAEESLTVLRNFNPIDFESILCAYFADAECLKSCALDTCGMEDLVLQDVKLLSSPSISYEQSSAYEELETHSHLLLSRTELLLSWRVLERDYKIIRWLSSIIWKERNQMREAVWYHIITSYHIVISYLI